MNIKSLLILIVYPLFTISLIGQELIPFKDRMSLENYDELLQKEIEANNEIDNFKKAERFKTLADESTRLSEDLAIIYYGSAMDAAIAAKNDSLIAKINNDSSIPYINKALFEEAEIRLNKALQHWHGAEDTLQMAGCYILLSYLERVKGSNYIAIKNLYKAKDLQKSKLPFSEMHGVVSRLIINYSQLKDYESAIVIGEEYLDSTRHLESKPRGYYNILRNTGEMKLRIGDVEGAKVYIDEALPIWMKARIPKFMVSSYSLLHDLSIIEGDLNQAKIYADSSLYYALQFKSPLTVSGSHLRVYHILKDLKQTDGLDYHINEALEQAMASNHKTTMINAARAASLYKSEQGQYTDAYRLLFFADSIRKEIYSEETINNIKNFEKQILQEENVKEVELLNTKNELTQNKLISARRRNYGLVAGLLIFSCLGWWIFSLYRKTHNQNQIISKALSEKNTLLKEIHHRVKNNLQFISSLLHLQTRHVSDDAALDALQEGQDRVQSMALIHQNLYQEDNLTGVDMQAYFEKLIKGLFDSYNIHDDRIQLELDITDIRLDVDTVIPLGLIVNELISNSLKHAFPEERAGAIKVSLDRQNDKLIMSIEDNGVGMSEEDRIRSADSFGYKLINAFCKQLEGEMELDNANGTKVDFVISSFEIK